MQSDPRRSPLIIGEPLVVGLLCFSVRTEIIIQILMFVTQSDRP
jgi:hypothetical protein